MAFRSSPSGLKVVSLTGPDERAGRRVSAVLDGLALQRASGALEIDGDPAGTIYLERGRVTLAQASWAPDLACRLRGAIAAGGHGAGLPSGDGDLSGRSAAAPLLRRGLISKDGLTAVLRSATIDAAIALTVPLVEEASVRGTTFVAGRRHWAGAFCQFDVDTLRAETAARAGRLAGCGLSHTVAVTLCDLAGPSAVIGRAQWPVIGMLTQPGSAHDLAWLHGLALYDTLEAIAGLVSAGLCVPAQPEPGSAGARRAQPVPSGTTRTSASTGRLPALPASQPPDRTAPGSSTVPRLPRALPRRDPSVRPGSAAAGEDGAAPDPVPGGAMEVQAATGRDGQPAQTPDVLQRVLEGLRKLK